MRALLYYGESRLAVEEVETPHPGPGQVRIRVRASGVCHSDLSARNGGLPQPMPAILGHEAAGDVVAVGDGVTGLAVGDRVIANWLPPCGSCPSCLRGQPYLCITHVIAAYVEPRFLVGGTPAYGLAGCGAFAEEMVLPQEGEKLGVGTNRIFGIAWAGEDAIEQVEVSTDGGQSWGEGDLLSQPAPYCWALWEYLWEVAEPGEYTLLARATSASGRSRPTTPATTSTSPMGPGSRTPTRR